MDLSFTETQGMLRETLARFLADTYDIESRKKMLTRPEGRDPGIWKAIATELGLTCAPFAEEHGGMGGGAIENMIMMEEFGKVIAIEPWLQTVVIGGGALKHAGGALAEATIPAIISGDCVIAFAYAEPQGRYNLADIGTTAKADGAGYVLNGHKGVVYAAPWATHLLVTARTGGGRRDRAGVELFLIEANRPGITRRDYPTVDGFMASEVYFENVAIPGEALLTGGIDLIERVVDEATVAVCAEASGIARTMVNSTVEYTKQRKQFGQPIGKFQVLQHRMSDMFVEAEQVSSMALMGTLKLDEAPEARKAAVSMAKAKVGKSLKFVGQNAIQTHGGIGITMELAIGHYFKRGTMIEGQFGSIDHHLDRFEALTYPA
ncbi:acyl-CoA dehydrogenase family protein [Novosphingobium sp.]|uniref:acyl-CoA dehydrogenase family protein n=1 Tax=Novosphingobium sp. TaxID=1874826 RepID=UPI0022C72175|nr:acyl-CoA dehydrogenase family protein [Novosphingobium sp.]MCZ8018110.1 acyl-CoA dehydrogenase family protein [Novosphingobium sp.]MCZ8034429.1 acyl-CoA dehydrogenase family protein [Novosphingobium sp.]MCZ8052397.1 acyl-CoA dehydrogenase family protein [Novosphingobium sp.]MCZ8061262.1 acyl-CoA dehydrogenase family protein [Novosphingobium sp.]MCZ8232893.1 acyl-CoA dehydrogenase family protein [Novosphingobium sp.]